jgi:CubicO group peptidase (beta-lactamase class C family)
MRRSSIAATALLLFAIQASAETGAEKPESDAPSTRGQSDRFERITPEAAGYSPEKLQAIVPLLVSAGSQSLLLVHDGKVFFEWGDIRKKHLVHSIRKALLNGLMGACYGEGRLDLSDTLADLRIDDIAPLTPTEKTATLQQVLQSRSGVYHPAAAESDAMSNARPARGSHAPGTHYYYNNWDFNVAGYVYEQLCGERIYDAFQQRIATPLGMLDYGNHIVAQPADGKPQDPTADGYYQLEPERSRFPAYHFRMSAHDLALYGQLFLNRGRWKDQQIIPADWIDLTTKPVSILNEEYGLAYGMLWDVLVPDAPDQQPSFFHTGAGVHMLGIYPKHKLVFVHRVDTEGGVEFDDENLIKIIRLVHGARLRTEQATSGGR